MLVLPHERDALLGPPGLLPPAHLPVRADPSHPLCPTVAYLPGLGFDDVAGNAPPLQPRPAAEVGVGPAGPAGRSAASNSFFLVPNARWSSALAFQTPTLVWWGSVVGAPGVNAALLGAMWSETAPGHPWVCYWMGLTGTGRLTAIWNTGPSTNQSITATVDHPVGRPFVAALALPAAGGAAVLYQDGEAVASAARSGSISYGGAPNLGVGGDSNEPARTSASECHAALIYGRPLSAADAAALAGDPLAWLTVG